MVLRELLKSSRCMNRWCNSRWNTRWTAMKEAMRMMRKMRRTSTSTVRSSSSFNSNSIRCKCRCSTNNIRKTTSLPEVMTRMGKMGTVKVRILIAEKRLRRIQFKRRSLRLFRFAKKIRLCLETLNLLQAIHHYTKTLLIHLNIHMICQK
jgi:hypothetical protein